MRKREAIPKGRESEQSNAMLSGLLFFKVRIFEYPYCMCIAITLDSTPLTAVPSVSWSPCCIGSGPSPGAEGQQPERLLDKINVGNLSGDRDETECVDQDEFMKEP